MNSILKLNINKLGGFSELLTRSLHRNLSVATKNGSLPQHVQSKPDDRHVSLKIPQHKHQETTFSSNLLPSINGNLSRSVASLLEPLYLHELLTGKLAANHATTSWSSASLLQLCTQFATDAHRRLFTPPDSRPYRSIIQEPSIGKSRPPHTNEIPESYLDLGLEDGLFKWRRQPSMKAPPPAEEQIAPMQLGCGKSKNPCKVKQPCEKKNPCKKKKKKKKKKCKKKKKNPCKKKKKKNPCKKKKKNPCKKKKKNPCKKKKKKDPCKKKKKNPCKKKKKKKNPCKKKC